MNVQPDISASGTPTLQSEPACFLNVRDLATLLRMPLGTVYHLLETGQIPGARKYGRAWRIRRDLVLQSHTVDQVRVSRSRRERA